MCLDYTTKDIERFWQKVDKRGPDDCWEWLGTRKSGHGNMGIKNRKHQAHRIAYELQYGPVPNGIVVRHMCNFSPCCNPAHLQLGTYADNNRDRKENKDPVRIPVHPLPGARPWAKWTGQNVTPAERFWAKVEKTNTCWLWTGYTMAFGHGQISVNGKPQYTHRFSWKLHNGTIPEGMEVCHSCDKPSCVNPDHLFLGSHAENMADCAKKGRSKTPQYKGEAHGRSKITDKQVVAIRNEYAAGDATTPALADKYGISKSSVLFIVHNKHWSHVDGPTSPAVTIQKGENNPASKLTEEQVISIRTEYDPGKNGFSRLAKKYGVAKPTIMRIINRESWKHI